MKKPTLKILSLLLALALVIQFVPIGAFAEESDSPPPDVADEIPIETVQEIPQQEFEVPAQEQPAPEQPAQEQPAQEDPAPQEQETVQPVVEEIPQEIQSAQAESTDSAEAQVPTEDSQDEIGSEEQEAVADPVETVNGTEEPQEAAAVDPAGSEVNPEIGSGEVQEVPAEEETVLNVLSEDVFEENLPETDTDDADAAEGEKAQEAEEPSENDLEKAEPVDEKVEEETIKKAEPQGLKKAAPKEEESEKEAAAVKAPANQAINVVYHFYSMTAADTYAETKTVSRTVRSGGSTTAIPLTTASTYVSPKQLTIDGRSYNYINTWKDGSGNAVAFPLTMAYDDAAQIADETYTVNVYLYAQYRADVVITLYFNDIRHADGTTTSTSTGNTIGANGGWSFTKKKLESTTGLTSGTTFGYCGYNYTYTGTWVDASGNIIDTSSSIQIYNKEGTSSGNTYYVSSDTALSFTPVYTMTMVQGLDYNYFDRISNGSGSWSNKDAFEYRSQFGSLTHTFRDPSVASPAPHYQFVYWQNDENGKQYAAGDQLTYYVDSGLPAGTVTKVDIYAYWQPSVTVNYFVDGSLEDSETDKLVNTVEDFSGVSVYDFIPEYEGAEFIGWFDADGNELSQDMVFAAPEVTKVPVERYIVDVYARFETPYTVEHYLEELDSSFTLNEDETEEHVDIIGETVEGKPKDFVGFKHDDSVDGTLKEEKLRVGTVLRLYYVRNTYTVTYAYTGETVPEGAEAQLPSAAVYRYGEQVPGKQVPSVTGYTFSGWNGEVNEMPANDVTVTGSWEINRYTVIWQNEDGTLLEKDENVPYGTSPSYDGSEPSKKATAQYSYSFTGWDKELTPVTEDRVYTAQFSESVNTYTVTWKNDDGTVLETDTGVAYGATPSYDSAEPAKQATSEYKYSFGGWNPEIVPVTEDAVYVASFSSEAIPAPAPQPAPVVPVPAPTPAPRPVVPAVVETEPDPEPELEPAVIENNPTPRTTPEPQTTIVDDPTPQSPPAQQKAWALINLISTIVTCLVGLGMAITFFNKKDDDEEEAEKNREEQDDSDNRKKSKFFGIIPAVGSVIAFILTENMKNPMVLTDKWTLMMILILLVNCALAFITRNKKDDEEEEQEANA